MSYMRKYGTPLMELSFFHYIMLLSELGTEPTKNGDPQCTHALEGSHWTHFEKTKNFGTLSKFFQRIKNLKDSTEFRN